MSHVATASRTNTGQIQVLHVDDEPGLADMVATYLQRSNDQISVTAVQTVDEALDQLADTDFDCIVSDYDMPKKNGIEFLETVRSTHPDRPFILYTGKGSEEIASDAITAGATDYLQKEDGTDHYTVLANRITNVVERDRAQSTVGEVQRLFSELANRANDVLWLFSGDWTELVFLSESYTDLWGQSRTTLQDDPGAFLDAIHPDDRSRMKEAMQSMSNGQSADLEIRVNESADYERYVWIKGDPITDDDGTVTHVGGFTRDITDRKARENELARAERQYEAMFEDPNILVGLTGTDGTVRDINQTAFDYIDASEDEIIGIPFWETPWFSHSEAIQSDVQNWIHRAANGEYVEFDVDLVRPDGTPYAIEGVIRPVMDETGDVVSLLISDRDITERRAQKRELERMRNLLNHTEHMADVGGWEIDTETMEVFWTEHLFELLGVDYDEEPPLEEALDIYHEDDRQVIADAVDLALESGDSFDVDVRFRRPDGEVRWLRVQGLPTMVDGDVVTLRGAVQDITDQRSRERDLQQAREEYEELFNGMNDSAWVIDLDGNFLAVNDTAVDRIGFSRETLLSMGPPDIDAGLNNDEIVTLIREMQEDEVRVFETIHETEDGERIPVEISSSLISYQDETAVLSVARGISDRKRREQQLEKFASVVSHDLRNPLSVARGRLELAREECDNEHLEDIERAHERMSVLIRDLLTLAREGDTVGGEEPVPLDTLVRECWKNVGTTNATLQMECTGTVIADQSRLQQLVENLIRNAVEHGQDVVTVTIGELDDGFYVEDDGPGIPEKHRESVFDLGYSTTDAGTGLGLHISKEVVDAHDWDIRIVDGAEGGARFEITNVNAA